jgi:hypothetical protein
MTRILRLILLPRLILKSPVQEAVIVQQEEKRKRKVPADSKQKPTSRQHQWTIKRQTIEKADARRRWDQLYLNLLHWTVPSTFSKEEEVELNLAQTIEARPTCQQQCQEVEKCE